MTHKITKWQTRRLHTIIKLNIQPLDHDGAECSKRHKQRVLLPTNEKLPNGGEGLVEGNGVQPTIRFHYR